MHSSSSTANLPGSKASSSTLSSVATPSSIQNLADKKDKVVNLEKSGMLGSPKKNIDSKNTISNPLPESSSDVVSSTMEEDVDNERFNEITNTSKSDERRRKTKNKVNKYTHK